MKHPKNRLLNFLMHQNQWFTSHEQYNWCNIIGHDALNLAFSCIKLDKNYINRSRCRAACILVSKYSIPVNILASSLFYVCHIHYLPQFRTKNVFLFIENISKSGFR